MGNEMYEVSLCGPPPELKELPKAELLKRLQLSQENLRDALLTNRILAVRRDEVIEEIRARLADLKGVKTDLVNSSGDLVTIQEIINESAANVDWCISTISTRLDILAQEPPHDPLYAFVKRQLALFTTLTQPSTQENEEGFTRPPGIPVCHAQEPAQENEKGVGDE